MTPSNICIAGYIRRGDDYECVRPVPTWNAEHHGLINESWLDTSSVPIRPFSIIELDLHIKDVEPPHIEDRVMLSDPIMYERTLSVTQRAPFLSKVLDPSVSAIFDFKLQRVDSGSWWVPSGSLCRSLGTIEATHFRVYLNYRNEPYPKWTYRLEFEDRSGTPHRMPITDLAARRYLQSLVRDRGLTNADASMHMKDQLNQADKVYLRIGLARAFEDHPDRCALLITGIYSFPDYLGGRTHADFPRDYA
jgi:hypothetical protein